VSYFNVCTYKTPRGVPFSCQLRGGIDVYWHPTGPKTKAAMRYKCGHCRRGNVAILRMTDSWTGWEFRHRCLVCQARVVVGQPQMSLSVGDALSRS